MSDKPKYAGHVEVTPTKGVFIEEFPWEVVSARSGEVAGALSMPTVVLELYCDSVTFAAPPLGKTEGP